MPLLLAGLGNVIFTSLGFALGSFFGRLILGLGISLVTYQGLDVLVSSSISEIESLLSFSSEISAYLGVLNVYKIISIWGAALTTKVSLIGLSRIVFNKG